MGHRKTFLSRFQDSIAVGSAEVDCTCDGPVLSKRSRSHQNAQREEPTVMPDAQFTEKRVKINRCSARKSAEQIIA
eukprot:2410164-Prymnesium_polylepis.1